MFAWLSAPALAIVVRHDVPDEAYVVADEDWPAVIDLFEDPADCAGTLVAPAFVLTVAHCARDLALGDALRVAGVEHPVLDVVLHEGFDGFVDDIALVRLAEPVQGVEPVPLQREADEVGQILTLVGRGLHATGREGERGGTLDGKLRRAHNRVERATPQWLHVTFEAPTDPGVLPLEGVGAAGDSGGPAFVERAGVLYLAGLNSWGEGEHGVATYGAQDSATRVSSFAGWVDGVIADPPAPTLSSGCSTAVGAPWGGSALLALLLLRRRP